MPPVSLHIPAFRVAGMAVRTRNCDEMDPATARIGGLWKRFYSQRPSGGDERIFGVYSAYESDQYGAFDLTAGVLVPSDGAAGEPGAAQVEVQAGDYLVFRGQGSMPQTVIGTWNEVWRYFDDNPQVQRRFGTDFEAHAGPDMVDIHIGVRG
ncbi:GyrI-like domain-containing protein [Verminephrobacter aporrectodeae]|uniref:AraC family transcriptional regulator n=1 Tax=Verminephrobacter aporrectodeae subsp. tuberculatae TaxID=1110392 RepID=A0ABT3KTA4_9BURK|nr:GyrI-like domain-containing protein [Verminephrobacter aporrectodeae]MCW5321555.1 AraC family transcriptional regulator [Verminephrobacter aporrectodeae subsp. tuberculatae]MCW8175003.1 AraC family transcriptional regulator [Verminephrobacter aporrectodeae subsp. tuberculatae]MCW8196952.1 AraC family transcriptional regulator [Verminephrobacter aporrectodeae subsp. tuberculatae]MCW8201600.1 AraC family transcriptional regulator [Verminephrobacter aporrectodeae subsp. tuberculatae]